MPEPNESKHAYLLRSLGFRKTGRAPEANIVEMLARLECCIYFAFTDPPKTYVTDETGQDWEVDAEVDLRGYEGIKPPWAYNDEPEMKRPKNSKH